MILFPRYIHLEQYISQLLSSSEDLLTNYKRVDIINDIINNYYLFEEGHSLIHVAKNKNFTNKDFTEKDIDQYKSDFGVFLDNLCFIFSYTEDNNEKQFYIGFGIKNNYINPEKEFLEVLDRFALQKSNNTLLQK